MNDLLVEITDRIEKTGLPESHKHACVMVFIFAFGFYDKIIEGNAKKDKEDERS